MDRNEEIFDMRIKEPKEAEEEKRLSQLMFRLNHTMPGTDEYTAVMRELFGENLGEGSFVNAPVYGTCFDRIKIGRNAYINSNFLAMARGGITIEDDVTIAANVQLLTNNHDPYERDLLTLKPVTVKKGAWIGAGATVLPGVSIGRYAIVGACAVVTKDVPDYGVAVGNPAKTVKTLDPEKCEKGGKD